MEIYYGIIAGIIYGIVDVLLMIPIKFDSSSDKKVAMIGAFASRLTIGFLIFNTDLPFAPWLSGIIIAVLVSLPNAIVTKSYPPILGTAILGGGIIGYLAS